MANATTKLILRTDKGRPDGTAPIYVRATYARRTRQAATGIWVEVKSWNPDRGQVRRSHPLADAYNARLGDLLNQAREAAMRARSAAEVIDALDGRAGSVTDFFREHNARLEAEGQHWELKKYRTTAKKLHEALGYPWPGGSIPWDALTPTALARVVRYCSGKKGNSANTVRKELVRLRSICMKAVKAGALRPDLDPFIRFELPSGQPVTRRRLSLEEIEALRALDLPWGSHARTVRDGFLLALYGSGIRISDCLLLTTANIVGDSGRPIRLEEEGHREVRLAYQMQKTGRLMTPKLPLVAVAILRPYAAEARPGRYVLPLMKRGDDGDPVSLRRRQQSATTLFNGRLKDLGEAAGIGREGLSSHVARHSFADVARKSGDVYAVSKALGHTSLQITQAYINSFDRDAVDALTDALWKTT